MAMLSKTTIAAKNACCSVLYSKTEPCALRFMSSDCGGDDKKSPKPGEPTLYDRRKYGHQLPNDDVTPTMFDVVPGLPSGIFRCTEGEFLGLGAGKCCYYRNPEYFSYHHMSFIDIHLHLKDKRLPQPDTKRKPL